MSAVLWKEEGKVGHLVLAGKNGNLMDRSFFDDLNRVLTETLPRSKAGAAVVYGQARHFSAGADVKALVREVRSDDGSQTLPPLFARNLEALERLGDWGKPVVAAVRGACLGSGLELALACTVRFCSETAVFSLPEASFGLLPGLGGIWRLQKMLGPARTAELVLTGRTLGAEEALSLGLVDRVLPSREVVDYAVGVAGELQALSSTTDLRPLCREEA